MLDIEKLTKKEIASLIDHTFLKPNGKAEWIENLCNEAHEHGFAMVAVNPAEVKTCVRLLKESTVRVGAAVGFPLGQSTLKVKLFETREAIALGAKEIDMVINQRAVRCGDFDLVKKEIGSLVSACKPYSVISKVILECCNLIDSEKIKVCQIAKGEGCDYVKTSTGFSRLGATVEDVRLMRETVGPSMGVKASGGIRNLDQTLAMIKAGASRIGTSSGVTIMDELKQRANINH